VGIEIYDKVHQEGYPQTDTTVINYTSKAKREYYGVAFGQGGPLGNCVFEYARKGVNGKPIPFTDEERQIYKRITSEYYGEDIQERTLFVVEALETHNDDLKDMNEDELRECLKMVKGILSNGKDYWDWRHKLERELGFKITKATRLLPKEIGA